MEVRIQFYDKEGQSRQLSDVSGFQVCRDPVFGDISIFAELQGGHTCHVHKEMGLVLIQAWKLAYAE